MEEQHSISADALSFEISALDLVTTNWWSVSVSALATLFLDFHFVFELTQSAGSAWFLVELFVNFRSLIFSGNVIVYEVSSFYIFCQHYDQKFLLVILVCQNSIYLAYLILVFSKNSSQLITQDPQSKKKHFLTNTKGRPYNETLFFLHIKVLRCG